MRPVGKSQRLAFFNSPTMLKAAAALAVFEGAKEASNLVSSLYKEHFAYTVKIEEDDHAYQDVHDWILGVLPSTKQRALVASTNSGRNHNFLPMDMDEDEDNANSVVDKKIRLSFNDSRPKRFVLDGHRITAQVQRPELSTSTSSSSNNTRPPNSILFTARTEAGQHAVIEKFGDIRAAQTVRKPLLRIVSQWGGWTKRSDLPLRDLDSVVLPAEQKTAIVEDLRSFLESEDRYVKLALPWHRGYMLHGPPGTGKTSLVKALANEFKLDLWYISLGDLKEEASLINLLADVGPRSILLLEDVDTIQLTQDRDRQEALVKAPTNISLSSLLNALDGVATPHGLITVMTTNHFDRLDPALVRAGRMDRVEELQYPTAKEVHDLYRRFYNAEMPNWEPGTAKMPFSQADLSEAFKRNLDDPEAAAKAAAELLRARMSLDQA